MKFDNEITINNKKFSKQIFKIKKSKTNNLFSNKKNGFSSSSSGDSSKQVNFKKALKCVYTNATSLNNKGPFFQTLLTIEEPDAVFISETWYKDNSCPSFPGYTLFRKDRVGPRQGGGVCIYIKNIFKSYEIPE